MLNWIGHHELLSVLVVGGFFGLLIAAAYRRPSRTGRPHSGGPFHPSDVFTRKEDRTRGWPMHPNDVLKPEGDEKKDKDGEDSDDDGRLL